MNNSYNSYMDMMRDDDVEMKENELDNINELEEDINNEVEDEGDTVVDENGNKVITSPLKAIRANCIQCCGDSRYEVKLCEIKKCPLWHFRFGKNPFNKRANMSEEERKIISERMKKAHREGRGGGRKKKEG